MDLTIGDKVQLKAPLPFLKTAEPMPMLRPPDLVSPEEVGTIVGLKGLDTAMVRFRCGTFLIPVDRLAKAVIVDD